MKSKQPTSQPAGKEKKAGAVVAKSQRRSRRAEVVAAAEAPAAVAAPIQNMSNCARTNSSQDLFLAWTAS